MASDPPKGKGTAGRCAVHSPTSAARHLATPGIGESRPCLGRMGPAARPMVVAAGVRRDPDRTRVHPMGHGVYYGCQICGSRLDSSSQHAVACSCRNLVLDIEAGRISVKDPKKVVIIEQVNGDPVENE